jgi:hypothetical protein
MAFEPVVAGGRPGFLARYDGRADFVLALTVHDGHIERIDIILNPDKLAAIERSRDLTIV